MMGELIELSDFGVFIDRLITAANQPMRKRNNEQFVTVTGSVTSKRGCSTHILYSVRFSFATTIRSGGRYSDTVRYIEEVKHEFDDGPSLNEAAYLDGRLEDIATRIRTSPGMSRCEVRVEESCLLVESVSSALLRASSTKP